MKAEVEALRKRKIKVSDLPLDQLRTRLNNEPQNPAEMILPNSIGPELLAEDARLSVIGWVVRSAPNMTLTESYATVPKLEYTIPSDGDYLMIAYLDAETTAGTFMYAAIRMNETVEVEGFKSAAGRHPMTLTSWVPDVAKGTGISVRVKRNAGSATVYENHSRLIVIRLGG